MKVKELMEKLKMFDPEAEVLVKSNNFELNGANVPASSVYQSIKGSKEIKTFRDAFDGETYNREVWFMTGGDLSVIYIV